MGTLKNAFDLSGNEFLGIVKNGLSTIKDELTRPLTEYEKVERQRALSPLSHSSEEWQKLREDAKKKDVENSKLSQETNELPPSDTNISESTFSKLDEWKKTHPLTDKKQSEDLEGKSLAPGYVLHEKEPGVYSDGFAIIDTRSPLEKLQKPDYVPEGTEWTVDENTKNKYRFPEPNIQGHDANIAEERLRKYGDPSANIEQSVDAQSLKGYGQFGG